MISEYNEELLKEVIEGVKNSNIVTLKIKKISNGDIGIEYTLYSEYNTNTQNKIKQNLLESFDKRLKVVKLLTSLQQHIITGTVMVFDFEFNAISNTGVNYTVTYQFADIPSDIVTESTEIRIQENVNPFDLVRAKFKDLNTKTGLCSKSNTGKQKKYIERNVGEVLDILEKLS